jgi:hypothetical protein
MKLFSILTTLLLSAEAKTHLRKMASDSSCQTVKVTSEGSAPNTDPLPAGTVFTWALPIYVGGTTQIGEWEGYCVGLGTDVDSAGGQICTNLYAIEENGGLFQVEGDEGLITGTSIYDAGASESTVVITGGSGSYQDASGAVNVTYANGSYSHAFTICF